MNASAEGGSGNYKYSVYYKQKQHKLWTVRQVYSINNSISIQPKNATDYDVCIKVKDCNGTVEKKYFSIHVIK